MTVVLFDFGSQAARDITTMVEAVLETTSSIKRWQLPTVGQHTIH